MKKWKLIAGVALVFVLGVLVGSLGTRFYHRDWWSEPFGKDSSARRVVVLKKLTKELRLTEVQQKEFKGIVEETDKKLEAFGLERRAEIKTILDESFSRMKEKLDPEQQKKLEELKARHEARLKDKKSRHHFP
jgi:Spy/CpxP family protein refolding chaperone